MSKTLHPFGRVLFDELEQVAVRRGGFASLSWVLKDLEEARQQCDASVRLAADPKSSLADLKLKADEGALRAVQTLERAAGAAEAVNELGEVVRNRSRTARRVIQGLRPPQPPPEPPIAFHSLMKIFRAFRAKSHSPRAKVDWATRCKEVGAAIDRHAKSLQEPLVTLKEHKFRRGTVEDKEVEDRYLRVLRVVRNPDRSHATTDADLMEADRARRAIDEVDDEALAGRPQEERLVRGAVILRARAFIEALDTALGQMRRVQGAYRVIAGAGKGVTTELWRMIEVQSDASRFEIEDIIEDGARGAALRMGTVGLAFSGGGIRSATFNLGFLQGLASLGLLKRFDYLSTVSGGGYIGSWFAAWIRREGGNAGEPRKPSLKDLREESEPHIIKEEKRIRSTGVSRATLHERLRQGRETVLAKVGDGLRAQQQAAEAAAPPEGASQDHAPPTADEVRLAAPRLREMEKQVKKEARKTPRAVVDREVREATRRIRREVWEELKRNYEFELKSKRRRTLEALENVEKQLQTSRVIQGKARRRWVTTEEIRKGREAPGGEASPLSRIVEEEPEPVHHLRAYSNYMTPKVGLLSIDTWTMVSVYLRNLLLNQFILLPMTLAAIMVPRLMLLLFAARPVGETIRTTRTWLEQNPRGLEWMVLGAALVGLTVPKLVDHFARKFASRLPGRVIVPLIAFVLLSLALDLTTMILPGLTTDELPGGWSDPLGWVGRNPWVIAVLALAPLLALAVPPLQRRFDRSARALGQRLSLPSGRGAYFWQWVTGWANMVLLVGVLMSLARWLPPLVLALMSLARRLPSLVLAPDGPVMSYLGTLRNDIPADLVLFLATLVVAFVAFARIYKTVALIRESRLPASVTHSDGVGGLRFDLPFPLLWEQILLPLTLVAFAVSLLFARPGRPFLTLPFRAEWLVVYDPTQALGSFYGPALRFGVLGGILRLVAFRFIDLRYRYQPWRGWEGPGRAASTFASGLISGAVLAIALLWIHEQLAHHTGSLTAAMMTLGPLIVMVAFGAGSAIEVGLIGDYGEEDMREWRASLGAYMLMIGIFWAAFAGLSVYGPPTVWWAGPAVASVAGSGWLLTSVFGVLAGGSTRTGSVKSGRSPLEYVALVAPLVFVVGLVIGVAALANVLQGVDLTWGDPPAATVAALADASVARTWCVFLGAAWLGTIGCAYVNINLFALNAFYANRLVRCYLGASRPREVPAEGRPNFAPTNSPVPVRRPNPITGFDPTDDFPLRDLAVVRSWKEDDLVVDYRGPYHLVNTAMNLVAGSELAWQERMAESFVLSPLYSGSKTTGYRKANVLRGDLEDDELEPDEREKGRTEEVPGYGGDVRLGTAVSVSGAAASPNAGYHSSPLVTILMTVFNARLGLWFGNPARDAWRRSGPGFALYLFDELFGRTTSKGKYVYLSDGGHFENLGVYELVRRRCRHIVLCDAGADPSQGFWDLGSLVRKCREDFGVRIEIDVNPLLKKEGASGQSKWHCAVGRIHYEDVDVGAIPGTLFYIKPSLTGDEPSDVRNYIVDHPTFPHESTADQFFSESQFESYRVLGEHVAVNVFNEVVRDAGPDPRPARLFSELRRHWFPPPPDFDKNFLEAVKPFVGIHEALRDDGRLENLSHELYPEIRPRTGAPATPGAAPAAPAAAAGSSPNRVEVHAVIQMLQAMENAWMAVNLESYSDHPLNRGWMNAFRRWTSSSVFQTYWPAVRGEFSEGFVRFCESELNLRVQIPKVSWVNPPAPVPVPAAGLAAAPVPEQEHTPGRGPSPETELAEGAAPAPTAAPPDPRSPERFREAVRELDEEFSLEWPHVVLPEIGEEPVTLAALFEHAYSHPPRGNHRLAAGLIVPSESANHGGRPSAEPRVYGVVLGWATDNDRLIDLVVWLRGAYRTLGAGRAAINETLDEYTCNSNGGFRLRTRYPVGGRSQGKQRWQYALWTDFFHNHNFHQQESQSPGDGMITLVYRHDPNGDDPVL